MLFIKRDQTLLDMTEQYTGTVDSLFLLATANGISITADLVPGNSLQEVPVIDSRVTNYFVQKKYDCTTYLKPVLTLGGIGYMKIGTSFKVS
jgi:hypothetical protein